MGPLLLLLLPLLLLFPLFLSHLAFCTFPNLFLSGQREGLLSMYTCHSCLPSETSILDSWEARGGGHTDLGLLWSSYRSWIWGKEVCFSSFVINFTCAHFGQWERDASYSRNLLSCCHVHRRNISGQLPGLREKSILKTNWDK